MNAPLSNSERIAIMSGGAPVAPRLMDPVSGIWPELKQPLTREQHSAAKAAAELLTAASENLEAAIRALAVLPVKTSYLRQCNSAIGELGKHGYLYGMQVLIAESNRLRRGIPA